MDVLVAVSKVAKYATSESGDTLEMVERPGGGLSLVLADGQRSGRSAKALSNVVARKAISLLGEGVRDGAAARAASDYLYTYRGGKVLATLNILSIDLQTQTMVVTRNNPAPVVIVDNGNLKLLDDESPVVGIRRGIRPLIHEIPLSLGLTAVVFTDGLLHAGQRAGTPMDAVGSLRALMAEGQPNPEHWVERLVTQAVELDLGRPVDDISVLVASVVASSGSEVRRLHLQLPLGFKGPG